MENLATLLQRALDQIVTDIDVALAEGGYAGIKPSHGVVFDNLDPEGTRLSVLAGRAGMSKQLMSYLVDPLVTAGYLERRPDPTDGRGRLITLTAQGRQAVRRAAKAIDDAEARWGAEHGSRRVATLRRVLEEVTAG